MKNKIFATLVLIVVGFLGFIGFEKYEDYQEALNQVQALQQQVAQTDSLHRIDSLTVEKQAVVIQSLRADSLDKLQLINEKDYQIRQKTELIGDLQYQLANIPTSDSTITDTTTGESQSFAQFEVQKQFLYLRGFFEKQAPYRLTINDFNYRLIMRLLVYQTQDRQWKTSVRVADEHLQITDVKTLIVPYQPQWYEQFQWSLGAGFGQVNKNYNISISTGIKYNTNALSLHFYTYGQKNYQIQYQKFFQF